MKKIVLLIFVLVVNLNFLFAQCTLNVKITSSGTIKQDSVCIGSNIQLQIASSFNANYTKVWSNGTLNANSISVSPLAPKKYIVTVDSSGCIGMDSVTVAVLPLPAVSIVALSSLCGAPVKAILSSSNTNAGNTYKWTPGNITSANDTINMAVNTTYTLKLTDDNGCSSSATKSVYLTKASFIYAMKAGDSVLFTNKSVGKNLIYNWYFGDSTNTSSLTNPAHLYAVPCKKYIVRLAIVDTVMGCVQSFTDSTVNVTKPSMVANFTATQLGNNVTTSNTSVGGFIKSYWNWGDGSIDSTLNASHSYSPSYKKDSVILTVKNLYGCTSSKKKYFYTGCKDSFNYSVTNNGLMDSIVFNQWSNQTIKSFVWTLNSGTLLTNTTDNPLVIVITSMNYLNACLKTTDPNGCVSNYCKTNIFSTGISDVQNIQSVEVYPNPASSNLYIDFNTDANKKILFVIYDILGKQVATESKSYSNNGLKHEAINLSSFSNGVYLINIKNESGINNYKKFVVSKN